MLRANPVAITLSPVLKRLFFILLMLVLPLQATWAAAGTYCSHEQGSAAQHFGHHAHQHQAPDKNDSGAGSSTTFHADCASCHLGSAGAAASLLAVSSSIPAPPAISLEISFLPSIFLEGPERPKWASAA